MLCKAASNKKLKKKKKERKKIKGRNVIFISFFYFAPSCGSNCKYNDWKISIECDVNKVYAKRFFFYLHQHQKRIVNLKNSLKIYNMHIDIIWQPVSSRNIHMSDRKEDIFLVLRISIFFLLRLCL